jgi:hypothetical protein
MIALIVFYAHIVGAAGGFTKRWQEEGTGEGFLTLFFMGLIFFVGWSMSSFIVKLLLPPEGFGTFFDRDAASLVLLTAMEIVFYYFYLRKDTPERDDQETIDYTNA